MAAFINANINPETVKKFRQGVGGFPYVGEYELGYSVITGSGIVEFDGTTATITVDSFLKDSDWDEFSYLRSLSPSGTPEAGHVLICTPLTDSDNVVVSATYDATNARWTVRAQKWDSGTSTYTNWSGTVMLLEIVPFASAIPAGA